jgi:hypothetical protein
MRATFLLTLLLSSQVHAATDCFPKDKAHMGIQVFTESIEPNAVSRTKFKRMIKRMETTFGDEVKAKLGCTYKVNDMWTDGTVNSQAYQQDGHCYVDAFGGLAKYPSITELGYYGVACHELGHHMGGAPLYPGDVMADEGEADTWSTLYCMKKLGFSDEQIVSGSKNLGNVLAELNGEQPVSDTNLDMSKVRRTAHEHPRAQCRYQTYLAGLACKGSGDMSMSDPKVGGCFSYPHGVAAPDDRPLCWFKP